MARSFASLPMGAKEQKGEPHQDSGLRAGCMRMLAGPVWGRDMGRSALSFLQKLEITVHTRQTSPPTPQPCRVVFIGLQKKEGNASSQV